MASNGHVPDETLAFLGGREGWVGSLRTTSSGSGRDSLGWASEMMTLA